MKFDMFDMYVKKYMRSLKSFYLNQFGEKLCSPMNNTKKCNGTHK